MDKFTVVTAIAVPFDESNVDTNQMCPTRFNKLAKGPPYEKVLFHDQRFDANEQERPDYILNRAPYRAAGIIVGDRNFGCGSSRESAVYALAAFGVRAVVAVSFGEIFASNCFKNSLLPVEFDEQICARLRRQLHENVGAELTVDLERQVVRDVEGVEHGFEVHPLRKRCLLNGLDDIALTRQFSETLQGFEMSYHGAFPWLAKAAG